MLSYLINRIFKEYFYKFLIQNIVNFTHGDKWELNLSQDLIPICHRGRHFSKSQQSIVSKNTVKN